MDMVDNGMIRIPNDMEHDGVRFYHAALIGNQLLDKGEYCVITAVRFVVLGMMVIEVSTTQASLLGPASDLSHNIVCLAFVLNVRINY